MKTQELNEKKIHYISDDGIDFKEDKEGCELYELKKVTDISNIPKVENLLFFYKTLTGFWCNSQEDLDRCIEYLNLEDRKNNLLNNKKNKSLNYYISFYSGRFIYPGYYFPMLIDSSKEIDSYFMISFSEMKKLWNLFTYSIPLNPDAKILLDKLEEDLQSIENNEYETIHDNINDENITVEQIFDKIKDKEEDLMEITNDIKFYRKEDLIKLKNENGDDKNE